MHKKITLSTLIGLGYLSIVSATLAADMEMDMEEASSPQAQGMGEIQPGEFIPLDSPMLQPVEVGNGWYLRGDIGYTTSMRNGTPLFNTFSVQAGFDPGTVISNSYDDHYSFGVGVGYIFNDMFRADVTLDSLNGDFTRIANGPALSCNGGGVGNNTCSHDTSGSYQNYMLMANAYVDLATISGFTPYVGVGGGLTKVNYGTVTSSVSCRDNAGVLCTGTQTVNTSHDGASQWRNTIAMMAGVSYDLSEQMKFDLGYKYSHVASGKSYNYDAQSVINGASGVQSRDGGFARHEFRVGLRLSTW